MESYSIRNGPEFDAGRRYLYVSPFSVILGVSDVSPSGKASSFGGTNMTPLSKDTPITRKRERALYYREYRKKKGANQRSEQEALRLKALEEYIKNPNVCLFCSKVIEPKITEKLSITKRKRYCDVKCSSASRKRECKCVPCIYCGKPLKRHLKKFCTKSCASRSRGILQSITKGDLFSKRSGYQSARSAIQRDARTVYLWSKRKLECLICGYSKHVDIAHIKPVSDFDDACTVAEINAMDNLVSLCPNHHWEFDHGFLKFNAGCFEGSNTRKVIRKRDYDQINLFPLAQNNS